MCCGRTRSSLSRSGAAMDEFGVIETFFFNRGARRPDVRVGIGDDGAVVSPPPGAELVVTTDLLVAGRHFPTDTDPYSVGAKAMAVNLSDLAAMAAEPAWATLTLALPEVDEQWLEEFSRGLFDQAGAFGVQLVGGDTVKGPLTVGLQLLGWAPAGTALLRHGAAVGDRIFVTGTLGDAGLGLRCAQGRASLPEVDARYARERLERPSARVSAGLALRGIASAAIDLSDGLAADLGHLAATSGVGARVELARLPLSHVYRAHFGAAGGWDTAVGNGDDYELCFTVPPERCQAVTAGSLGCPVTEIGEIVAGDGVALIDEDGARFVPRSAGFDHFRGDGAD
jgi:thiamine-monophosphate kinase